MPKKAETFEKCLEITDKAHIKSGLEIVLNHFLITGQKYPYIDIPVGCKLYGFLNENIG